MDPRDLGCKCDACPLNGRATCIPEQVTNPKPKLLAIIVDSPTGKDCTAGQLASGFTGKILYKDVLAPVGIGRKHVHLTSTVLCQAKGGMKVKQWKEAQRACFPRLEKELEGADPKGLLVMGDRGAQFLCGARNVNAIMGAPAATKLGVDAIVTDPPNKLMLDRWEYTPMLRIHARRAAVMASGNLPKWEWGDMHYKVSEQMFDAINQIMNSDEPIAVDIESTREKPFPKTVKCIGFANSEHAVSVPWHTHNVVSGTKFTYEEKKGKKRRVKQQIYESIKGVWDEQNDGGLYAALFEASINLLHSDKVKILQNGIFDRVVLRQHDVDVKGPFFDLLFAHLLLSPGTEHGLGFQAGVELYAPKWKQEHAKAKEEMEK